jgi:hypothetical protein
MSTETIALVVLFVSVLYLLDRLMQWGILRGLAAYRRRRARPDRAPEPAGRRNATSHADAGERTPPSSG